MSSEEDTLYVSVRGQWGNRKHFQRFKHRDLLQGRGYTEDERHERQGRAWWSK